MTAGKQEKERVAAICENCGTVHAANIGSGGEVRPIGSKQCQCGDGEFRILEDTPDGFEETDG